MRPPLRRLVPIGSFPYRTVASGSTPAVLAGVPCGLVVTSGGVLRPRVNQPRYSKRTVSQNQLSPHPQVSQKLSQQLSQTLEQPHELAVAATPVVVAKLAGAASTVADVSP